MPLLVYPLLSMTLQRLLLATSAEKKLEAIVVGVLHADDLDRLSNLLKFGEACLSPQVYHPLAMESDVAVKESFQEAWRGMVLTVSIDEALRTQAIDLALEIEVEELPSPAMGQSATPCSVVAHYRPDLPRSQQAYRDLRRLLESINDAETNRLRQTVLGLARAPVELATKAVAIRSDWLQSVAAVIPLMLLLMTITGAVYPAIDLTAGEKERGTFEAMIATPTPPLAILLSKYVAVLVVSILTATIHLLAMYLTLRVGGIGQALFGNTSLSLLAMMPIFGLMLLFSSFFSAVLLGICSLARSFKEAQAYLIPVMLLSFGPGVISLLPSIQLTSNLAVVPLINILLLARDILAERSQPLTGMLVVVSSIAYSLGALVLASRLFSQAIPAASSARWSWPFRLSAKAGPRAPTTGDLIFFLALLFPIYYVASNSLGSVSSLSLPVQLGLRGLLTCLLFLVLPYLYARGAGLDRKTLFPWARQLAWWRWLPACLWLGSGLWVIAHEIFIVSQELGWISLRLPSIEAVLRMAEQLRSLPLGLVWLCLAITPAVAEEFFFRGFVMRSLLTNRRHRVAIILSAILFGLFHVTTGNVLMLERFLPTTFLGLVLGWLAYRCGSLLPGMVVHAVHNGLLFTILHYRTQLEAAGWGLDEETHLPWPLIAAGCVAVLGGLAVIRWTTGTVEGGSPPSLPAPASTATNPPDVAYRE
jgi:ABC-2 type transport system permease protein/sodium transport system permease protein